MWFKIKSFLKFLVTSTNQHGVHSPFVFNLVTKCFYKKSTTTNSNKLKSIRNWLYSNNQLIKVQDFGAGSSIFKNNTRKVSKIAKVAGISQKKTELLERMIAFFDCENILEIGTSVGLATASLSVGNPKAKITTLEGCKNTASIAQTVFQKFNINNIQIHQGEFDSTLNNIVLNQIFDFIYFDGNHQKNATLNYFNQCLPTIHNNSVFVFDDIYWSEEMQQAWRIIKNHPKVTVTINTFFWGIVFFRKEQEKQHFTLRI